MPESPDFASIARHAVNVVIEELGFNTGDDDPIVAAIAAAIGQELRLVWNARGAADIAKLEATIPAVSTAAEAAGLLTRALRSLDVGDRRIS